MMIFGNNKFALGALMAGELVILSACGANFDYKSLRQTEAVGTEFGAALSRAYKELALYEADEMYDWADAARYGGKSLAAGAGHQVLPDRLDQRRLPAAARPILAAARGRLTTALKGGAGAYWPGAAADAQSGFDCWMEQQEEIIQADHIAACRGKFQGAMARLDAAVRSNSTLYFEFDNADLAKNAGPALDKIVAAYRSGAPVTIVLGGHADRAGPAPYNRALSRRRSEAVRRALIERGIPIQLISQFAFGEERPQIATSDGARERRNRRVEIRFSKSNNL
ncbi:MAG: OmpA family protein [Rhodospirillaceae bacterium]|nr:OmpA family protein [Rhodospirillaceae bacterium]MBT3884206.1 OmpA family protein [Rhodospirillaceae bacterium]MBT4118741.1 OmpA family protein [Rhodospirillaceae bacterium]MBT4672465.1 OmpA family protein [Rhodospirillaceae bacterium]MBT5839530.1 OmpA family protein [Rhodospirillaceae bacterium]